MLCQSYDKKPPTVFHGHMSGEPFGFVLWRDRIDSPISFSLNEDFADIVKTFDTRETCQFKTVCTHIKSSIHKNTADAYDGLGVNCDHDVCCCDTNSIPVNVGSVPDTDYDVNEVVKDEHLKSKQLRHYEDNARLKSQDESHILENVGTWCAASEITVYPREIHGIEASTSCDPGHVELDDLRLECLNWDPLVQRDVVVAKCAEFGPSEQFFLEQLYQETSNFIEPVPTLTEGSSRDSESIAVLEAHQLEPELIERPWLSNVYTADELLQGIHTRVLDGSNSLGKGPPPSRDGPTTNRTGVESKIGAPVPPTSVHNTQRHYGQYAAEHLRTINEDEESSCSNEESSETESFWVSNFSEDIPTLAEGHPYWAIKPIILQEALNNYREYGAARHKGKARETNSSAARNGCHPYSNSESTKDSPDTNGETSRNGGSSRRSALAKKSRKSAPGPQNSFGCPFAKKDPIKYHKCYTYTLTRIRDVKQHLSRCHKLPAYSRRCRVIFESVSEADEHAAALICPSRPHIIHEGVTEEQKTLLGQKAKKQLSQDEQWFAMFDILFPNHNPRPKSAYINLELATEMRAFQDFTHAEGPNLIQSALASMNIRIPDTSGENCDISALIQSVNDDSIGVFARRLAEATIPAVNDTQHDQEHTLENSPSSFQDDSLEPSPGSSEVLIEHDSPDHGAEVPVQAEDEPARMGEMEGTLVGNSYHLNEPPFWADSIHDPDMPDMLDMSLDFLDNPDSRIDNSIPSSWRRLNDTDVFDWEYYRESHHYYE
ncbi:hypothetical protein B0J14DRAFT_555973 [Halenospora varia]|nr:hypothetical protein B0J14DRAFT_555973 [Halenospora varia]